MATEGTATASYRWLRGFDAAELEAKLIDLRGRPSSGPASDEEAARDASWHHYYSEALIARENPGTPELGGAFQRARECIAQFGFSDPEIVEGHFDPAVPLQGRLMLLDLKVMGLHYLCGVLVRAVRDELLPDRTVWGFRYDTLEGHLESGAEWFLLTKDHATGEIRFRIQAAWREAKMPNWWTRFGFRALGRPYQRAWHRAAYVRLRALSGARGLPALPGSRRIMHVWQPGAASSVTGAAPILETET